MKKIYRYIKFHFRTAAKNLTRHFGLAMSAAFSVTITLILISVFMLLTSNLDSITNHIEDQVTIRANIDNVLTKNEKTKLTKTIEQMDNVRDINLLTGEEELQAYKQEYAKESNLFEMYEGKTNPIQDTFTISLKDTKKTKETASSIEKLKGITSVNYGGSLTDNMIATFKTVKNGSAVFIGFLVLVAIFLISNKIKMSIYTRKAEIAIMRNVGASNWCVKFPMMLEGIVIGMIGSILPIIITIFGYRYFYGLMQEVMVSNMFQLQSVFPLTLDIAMLLLGTGMLVGLMGSFFSTTRYLKWKR